MVWLAGPKCVVAIPVRDEAERIAPCLTALNAQIRPPNAVVLLLNNCTDETEMIVRAMAPRLLFHLDTVRRDLPPAHANAGHARLLAMQWAAGQAGKNDVLLTTDADAIVPLDWVIRNLRALETGADLVCGQAVIDPLEARMIPARLHADDALECRLITLLDTLAWLLDPEPHDPPPRHTEASGASLAVRADVFHRVGGIPDIPAGEDPAFVRALWMIDARVRHDPAIQVVVSGRVIGRADGGMADAIRRRIIRQDEFTDAEAEPAEDAFRRYSLRYRARCVWAGAPDATLAGDLGLSRAHLSACMANRFFGSAWADLEVRSAVLQRRRVRFVDLPKQIGVAEVLLHQVALSDPLAAD
jgi:glycosyltransferase involved in cell wall biosynthesis